jgi:hypothetical protein
VLSSQPEEIRSLVEDLQDRIDSGEADAPAPAPSAEPGGEANAEPAGGH